MQETPYIFSGWLLALSFALGGFVLGLFLERVVLRRLVRISESSKWEGMEVIIGALRNMVLFWATLAGLYLTATSLHFPSFWNGLQQKLFLIAVIFSVTIVLVRLTDGMVVYYTKNLQGILPQSSIFRNLLKILIFVLGILIILGSLGISVAPVLTALGVGGLAVALALQDTLSNLFSGIQIILSKQTKVGDYVELEPGKEGYVEDINWRNTTIRTLPNNRIIIPNSKLTTATITNYHQPQKELSVLVPIGVSYTSDLAQVERVTVETARQVMAQVNGGIPEFDPFIRYHTFADFSINFSVILRAREFTDQYLIKHEFVKALMHRYRQEGIEIPFPIRTVYLHESG